MGEPYSPNGGQADEQPSTPNGPPGGTQSPPPPSDGNVGVFPSGFHNGVHDFDKLCEDIRGAEISLRIKISECGSADLEKHMGTEHFINMYMGEDVVKAKHMLSQSLSVDYHRIALYVGGKLMMDPLSLSDIPEICADQIMDLTAKLK